jgi:hypothetical protein
MSTEIRIKKIEMAYSALFSIGCQMPFSEESIVNLIEGLLHLAVQEQIDPRQVVARAALQFYNQER